jgi:hypothetical protein
VDHGRDAVRTASRWATAGDEAIRQVGVVVVVVVVVVVAVVVVVVVTMTMCFAA